MGTGSSSVVENLPSMRETLKEEEGDLHSSQQDKYIICQSSIKVPLYTRIRKGFFVCCVCTCTQNNFGYTQLDLKEVVFRTEISHI